MIHKDNLSVNAMGGSEMMKYRLELEMEKMEPGLLDKVQIVVSRERELVPDLPAIFWAQDLAEDNEAINAMGNGGWKKYTKIIFVSHWQKERYVNLFDIPYSHCIVFPNCIDKFDESELDKNSEDNKIRLIYTPTPHRGLEILVPVFEHIVRDMPDIHLDIFSSFNLYGWKERDKAYEKLFERIDAHPQMTNHGTVKNSVVRDYLCKSHIFVYPSIWKETSGITLIEAMSSRNLIVASDLAAIPETTSNHGVFYQYTENIQDHASTFYSCLKGAIEFVKGTNYQLLNNTTLRSAKEYADFRNNWEFRAADWYNLLKKITD